MQITGITLTGMTLTTIAPAPPAPAGTTKAIFGFGQITSNPDTYTAITNLVSNTGVVATNTTGVGTVRNGLAAAGYGTDKAIFGYGGDFSGFPPVSYSLTNLVSSSGVVATDTTGVGTARVGSAAAGYGTDKAIFGYGLSFAGGPPTTLAITNLVSNTGVVATDTTGVGTARVDLAAAGYGSSGQAIFGYGDGGGTPIFYSITNLVSNTGVVATDTSGVGTARSGLAAAGYGSDKAIFGYGQSNSGDPDYIQTVYSLTNLVSNTGVVATDTTGVGTVRNNLAAAGYGSDKAIFGYGVLYGASATYYSLTNLVSNTGVVATDTSGVGTARSGLAAAGYSTT